MTIQRQYILPNCSLILEGLSTDPSSQVLSILANAECKIVGIEHPISGGLEFFQALVKSVSHYAQGILSGLPHPPLSAPQSNLVQIKPDDAGLYHHLWVQDTGVTATSDTKPSEKEASSASGMTEVKLSTVQLFDLAEAIDQFFADTQTLPDLKLQLEPLSKRFVKSSEPLAQRATPPLLGIGVLAVAALGCFFLPIPEIPEVDPLTQGESQVESLVDGTVNEDGSPEGGTAGDDPDSATTTENLESDDSAEDALNNESSESLTGSDTAPNSDAEVALSNGNLPLIEDEGQIATLQSQLTEQLQDSDATFDETLIYRVSVAENGDVVGYRHENDAALANEEDTPLPQLTYELVEEGEVRAERVAQFQVVFEPDGSVEVSPWNDSESLSTPNSSTEEEASETSEGLSSDEQPESEPEAEPKTLESDNASRTTAPSGAVGTLPERIVNEIETPADIVALNSQLRQSVVREQGSKTFEEMLTYRVRVSEDGTVVGYEASDSIAGQSVPLTPLPDLVKAVETETPQVDFRVVLQPNGVVEVSPWRGWP